MDCATGWWWPQLWADVTIYVTKVYILSINRKFITVIVALLLFIVIGFGGHAVQSLMLTVPQDKYSALITNNFNDHSAQLLRHYHSEKTLDSVSGQYLAGRFAQEQKDWDSAYQFIESLYRKQPNNAYLVKYMMALSMETGQAEHAIKTANKLLTMERDNSLAMLIVFLQAVKEKNYHKAQALLLSLRAEPLVRFILPMLDLWLQAAKGQLNIEGINTHSLYLRHLLMVGILLDQPKQVANIVATKIPNADITINDIEILADFMAVYNHKDVALQLYQSLEKINLASVTVKKKINLLQGISADAKEIDRVIALNKNMSVAKGFGSVFKDMAQILYQQQAYDSAIIFFQMALYLDQDNAEIKLMIADFLHQNEQYEQAKSYIKKIKSDHKLYSKAQKLLSEIYQAQNKPKQAIAILNRFYHQSNDLDALVQVGHIYRSNKEYRKAIRAYSNVLDHIADNESGYQLDDFWQVLYARGMAYERDKDFKNSEIDLLKALEFEPDHPHLLNYLAYSWVDQGVHIERSLEMLRKAVQAQPDDGYIVDSLGWAYYRKGDYESAIIHLEKAVSILPYDATINDHLGDAYWHIGRKKEAKFQWRRAYNYADEDEQSLKDTIEKKLNDGFLEYMVH